MTTENTRTPLQLLLFVPEDEHLTNTIALWDSAPRWVLRSSDQMRDGRYLKTIERTFTHAGKRYGLVLKPARIKSKGQEIEEYPGEREQIIELVIQKIAQRKDRLWLEGRDEVSVSFTIYELQQELGRNRHMLSYAEIYEALQIMREASVEISRLDEVDGGEKERVVSTSTFPQIRLGDRKNENSLTTVQLNWLVARAIRHLEYRQINYEVLVEDLHGPIERAIFYRLNHEAAFSGGVSRTRIITALEIAEACGLNQRSRIRDAFRRITTAVQNLRSADVLDEIEAKPVRNGRKIDDWEYHVTLSAKCLDEMLRSETRASENKRHFVEATGTQPEEFISDSGSRERLLTLRKRRVSRDGKVVALTPR